MPESAVAPPRAEIRCLFCDQPERVEIFEVWGHEWMFDTCCEGFIWTTWCYTYASC